MQLSDVTNFLEELAPLQLQESYDNAGLLIGEPEMKISGVLVAVDLTEEVLKEAQDKKCNLVITHHPLIFKGIKKITGRSAEERMIAEAIRKDVAIYAMHTNLDNVNTGVNKILSEKIGLEHVKILLPKEELLFKLVTFCPRPDAEKVRIALFNAGAGHIGNYDSCSFNVEGTGSFRGSDDTNPYVGEKGKLNYEPEVRIEVIYPGYYGSKILKALLDTHPYEEVAYDIYPLANKLHSAGAGMIGVLPEETTEEAFLAKVKQITGISCIRHSGFIGRKVRKVALCGGAGSFLITKALSEKADIFMTGDLKYHDFFLAEKKILIADIGHYESEQFVKELIYRELIKKFSNFAVLISEASTNSVNYF